MASGVAHNLNRISNRVARIYIYGHCLSTLYMKAYSGRYGHTYKSLIKVSSRKDVALNQYINQKISAVWMWGCVFFFLILLFMSVRFLLITQIYWAQIHSTLRTFVHVFLCLRILNIALITEQFLIKLLESHHWMDINNWLTIGINSVQAGCHCWSVIANQHGCSSIRFTDIEVNWGIHRQTLSVTSCNIKLWPKPQQQGLNL